MPTSLRLVSFFVAASTLAACGPGPSPTAPVDSGTPATPVATPGDPTAVAGDAIDSTPWISDQTRKAHGLVSRSRPRHRRVLPR
jgi:hypothetical protein